MLSDPTCHHHTVLTQFALKFKVLLRVEIINVNLLPKFERNDPASVEPNGDASQVVFERGHLFYITFNLTSKKKIIFHSLICVIFISIFWAAQEILTIKLKNGLLLLFAEIFPNGN